MARSDLNRYVTPILDLLTDVEHGYAQLEHVEQQDDYVTDTQITHIVIRQSRAGIGASRRNAELLYHKRREEQRMFEASKYSVSAYSRSMADVAQVMQDMQKILGSMPSFDRLELKPPTPIEELGETDQLLTGYRDFVIDEALLLVSRNKILWEPREALVAHCTKKEGRWAEHTPEDAPVERCTCGIYAYDSPNHKDMKWNSKVWGEVYLWGSTFICESGFRAKFAYPKTFFMLDDGTMRPKRIADILEDTYGVPVYRVTAREGLTTEQYSSRVMDAMLKGIA